MWNGFKVIDADAHMHEPRDLWERYIEPKYRNDVPRVAHMNGTFMVYEPDGKFVPKQELEKRPPEKWAVMEEKYGEGCRTWWAPQTRLKDMDRHGWDCQVLLPTANNGFFACHVALIDIEVGAAMCRAYNNWCHEYCSVDPKRLKFVALVPGSDPAVMLEAARHAVEQLGAVAIRNPILPQGKWLHEPDYDALWQLACELDFPIAVHGELRQRFRQFKGLRINEQSENSRDVNLALQNLDHAIAFPYDNLATLGHFICAGVLQRFPKLRLAILESNAAWIPFWLGRLDTHTHGRYNAYGTLRHLPMLPSEYFRRQCTATCDSDESGLQYAVAHLEGENIAWNTDYPHPDGMDPPKALPEFFSQPISEDAKRKILWDNAIKLYGPRMLNGTV